MNLAAQDIAHYLKQHPLPAVTLIYGSEALLNSEALDAARARALADGYDERQRLYGDTRIDTLIAELETPSLFAPRRLLELSRLEKDPLNKQPLDIATLRHKLVHAQQARLAQKRLSLHENITEEKAPSSWPLPTRAPGGKNWGGAAKKRLLMRQCTM